MVEPVHSFERGEFHGRAGHTPTDNAPRESVDDEGDKDETVVFTGFPRITPTRPISRISRTVVQRATSTPLPR